MGDSYTESCDMPKLPPLASQGRRKMASDDRSRQMTHTEIIKRLVGPISPAGDYGTDIDRLKNLKTLSGVVLDLVQEIVAVSNQAKGRPEASVQTICKYADDTIGIINENTGAFDEIERLRAILSGLPRKVHDRRNTGFVCGCDGDAVQDGMEEVVDEAAKAASE